MKYVIVTLLLLATTGMVYGKQADAHSHVMTQTATGNHHEMSHGAMPAQAAPTASGAITGADVRIKVKGMVCSFCAQGLKKAFLGHSAVTHAEVSLKDKTVDLKLKAAITDKEIQSIVNGAGYNVEEIIRK